MTRLEAIKFLGERLSSLPNNVIDKINQSVIREPGEDVSEYLEDKDEDFYGEYETFLSNMADTTFFNRETTSMTLDEKNYLYTLKAETYLVLSELHLVLKKYVKDSVFDKS